MSELISYCVNNSVRVFSKIINMSAYVQKVQSPKRSKPYRKGILTEIIREMKNKIESLM